MMNPNPNPDPQGNPKVGFMAHLLGQFFGTKPVHVSIASAPASATPSPATQQQLVFIQGIPHLFPFRFLYHHKETPAQAAESAEGLKHWLHDRTTRLPFT